MTSAFIATRSIAHELNLTEHQVQRIINDLCAEGYVTATRSAQSNISAVHYERLLRSPLAPSRTVGERLAVSGMATTSAPCSAVTKAGLVAPESICQLSDQIQRARSRRATRVIHNEQSAAQLGLLCSVLRCRWGQPAARGGNH